MTGIKHVYILITSVAVSEIVEEMATIASMENFPGMSKESFPQDWFPGSEEVREMYSPLKSLRNFFVMTVNESFDLS